jgi:hypothetical protein
MSAHDDWKATWDWATKVWGDSDDHSFNRFFRTVAQKVAEAEEWEELGSSDVWHATKWMVDDAQRAEVATREELVKAVLECSGYFYGIEERVLVAMYGGN